MARKPVLTGPLAVIKVKGVTVGQMKGIRIFEDYGLGRVVGLGELPAQELPVTSFAGTCSCDFYEVEFESTGLPGAMNRRVSSVQEFIDNVLLDDEGVDLVIFKKVEDSVDPSSGLRKAKLQEHASVQGLKLKREGMNVDEGQISGHNQEFEFTKPITYLK